MKQMLIFPQFGVSGQLVFVLTLWIGLFGSAFGQTTIPVNYPRVVAYLGVLHPLVSHSNGETTTNFTSAYVVGFPTGVNLWKTARLGYSLEIVPLVRAEAGSSRVNNVLIHPGVLVGLGHGFTFAGRAAFETSGRYGLTPVLNKLVAHGKNTGLFVAIPVPIRFGNSQPTSVTLGFQFGITF